MRSFLTLWTILHMQTGFNSRSWTTKSESLVTFDFGSRFTCTIFWKARYGVFVAFCFPLSFHPLSIYPMPAIWPAWDLAACPPGRKQFMDDLPIYLQSFTYQSNVSIRPYIYIYILYTYIIYLYIYNYIYIYIYMPFMDDFFFTLFCHSVWWHFFCHPFPNGSHGSLALDGGHAHLQLCVGVLRFIQELLAEKKLMETPLGKRWETLGKPLGNPWETLGKR